MAREQAGNFWYRMANRLTGKSFDAKAELMASETPEVGTKYSQTTDERAVWVVETVLSVTASRFPLVRLTRENHPDLMKVVSVPALSDSEEFTRLH